MGQNDVDSILALEERLKSAQQELVQSQQGLIEERQNKLKALQQSIINGESTGDKVKDFLIVTHCCLGNPGLEGIYKGFEDALKGGSGKVVMKVEETEESLVHYLLPPSDGREIP